MKDGMDAEASATLLDDLGIEADPPDVVELERMEKQEANKAKEHKPVVGTKRKR